MASKKKSPLRNDPYQQREAEKYAEPIASREHILAHLRAHQSPCTFEALRKQLRLRKPDKVEALRRRLKAMLRDGQLILNRREEYLPINDRDLLRGRVIAHPEGYGFFRPDEGGEDLFIPAHEMRMLLHGDRIVARIAGISRRGKTEVALVEVLQRANEQIVGRLFIERNIAFVVADNKRIHQDILILDKQLNDAQQGQIVVAEIIEQPTRHRQPIGRIVRVLGNHMAPGMEVEVAINAHGLPHHWPEAVEFECRDYQTQINPADYRGRVDLREIPLLTIDGEDAKDFDDAIYCEAQDNGWRLLVAIADVSHYVQPGSGLDEEAYRRGTSVYFPGKVVPMLPEILSNELCSLKPEVERLCMVCEMRIGVNGELRHYRFFEAVMRSRARLTYNEVADLLLQKRSPQQEKYRTLLPYLQEAYALYKALAQARRRRGAIDFDTVESKIIFGADRKIEKIEALHRNDAHRLIEECMIAANIAAAKFLTQHNIAGLYRVHEVPPAEKVEDLKIFLGGLDISFAPKQAPKAKTYAALLQKVQKREDARLIETVLLRSLSQASYTPDNAGHFGLALSHYAHFTSPIRRYPDLLVHRAIRYILQKKAAHAYYYSNNQMRLMGEHCSMTERRADEASRDALDWLKCEYMLDKVDVVYDGLITGVTSFGLFVELNDIYVEGLLHVSELGNDYFHFDPHARRMLGERSGRVFRLADRIKVKVKQVNLDERQIDLALITTKTTIKKRTGRK